MDIDEATDLLRAFASSFAGRSYDEMCRYDAESVRREVTGAGGAVYELWLGTTCNEQPSADPDASRWCCRVTVSATAIANGKPSRRSLMGRADLQPGDVWNGELDDTTVTEAPSIAGQVVGCTLILIVIAVTLFAITCVVQSCRLDA